MVLAQNHAPGVSRHALKVAKIGSQVILRFGLKFRRAFLGDHIFT
jgi:hypothetical protein